MANGKIAKDQAAGKLTFTVGKTVKPGDYNFEVTAQMRLNNQNITVKQPVIVKVTALNKLKHDTHIDSLRGRPWPSVRWLRQPCLSLA